MKKILSFAFLAILVLSAISCKNKKNNEPQPQADARDAFVGEYTLVLNGSVAPEKTGIEMIDKIMPESLPISNFEDILVISKDESSANKVNITGLRGLYNCSGSVSGNELFMESSVNETEFNLGEVSGIKELDAFTIPVNYTLVHKTAVLNDNVLSWHTDGTGGGSFDVPIVGTVNMSGSVSIDNTATKK